MTAARPALSEFPIHAKLKLSALWISAMFCFIYADYFGLYVPGRLQSMLDGRIGPLGPTTQGVLLGTSVTMAIPSLMIVLSLVLGPRPNRVINMVVGALYTAITLLTMWRWAFYVFFGAIEVVLTGLVIWYAWKWPRDPAEPRG